jgi:hypothetical protein
LIEGLKILKTVEDINLIKNNLDDSYSELLCDLFSLVGLKRLDLSHNNFNKSSAKKIKNNLRISCMSAHNKSGILVCCYNEGVMCVWDIEKILQAIINNNKFVHEFEKYSPEMRYVALSRSTKLEYINVV